MAAETIRTGRDLAAERVRRGLFQRDVAEVLGVTARRVSQIEARPTIALATATRYLAALRLAPTGAALSPAVASVIEDLAAALTATEGTPA